jgi:hypothetical protein
MLWICMLMCPYHIIAALIEQAFGSELEFWVTPRQQMLVKCGDWGCRTNPDWSHINVEHIQCDWQPSYAVDMHMDVSLPLYSCSCRPSFWNWARILGNSQAKTDVKVWWLRLYTHSRLISHQCQIYVKCFTTFTCGGCAYGCVLTTLQLLWLTKLLEVS